MTQSPAYRWLVLFVLFIVYTFNFLDRQLMSILQEPIKAELGLSDSQLGLMTGLGFALFYTGFGVIVGVVADRMNRVRILFAGAFLWSLFTALCGLAKSFPMLLVSRMGVGVGEAAGAPPSYSIISDYFPPKRRGLALAIFSLGVPVGIALGAAFGAKLHELWGWRNAFVIIGLAGIVAAVLMLVIVREPKRGAFDAPDAQPANNNSALKDFSIVLKSMIATPGLRYVALAAGMSSFANYAMLNWNASFLIRVGGADFSQIATWYAMVLALTLGGSMLVSGVLIDWLGRRSMAWYGYLPAAALIISLPFYYLFVSAQSWQAAMVWMGFPLFLTSFYFTPALAFIQSSAKPHQRTTMSAIYLLVINLIGLGGGPTFVGIMSDLFSTSLGDVEGLRRAMFTLIPFFILGAVFLTLLGRTADQKDDMAAIERS